jgi:hypothetical protein
MPKVSVAEFAKLIRRRPQYVHMLIRAMGLPCKKRDSGRREVDVQEAAAWLRKYLKAREEAKPSEGSSAAFSPGSFLRWSRGRHRGYAYAIVVESDPDVTVLLADYSDNPMVLETTRLRRDIQENVHDTRVVGRYEALRYVANQLHRAHWAVALTEFDGSDELLELLTRVRQEVLALTKES